MSELVATLSRVQDACLTAQSLWTALSFLVSMEAAQTINHEPQQKSGLISWEASRVQIISSSQVDQ